MNDGVPASQLLMATAIVEAVTGVALVVDPGFVVGLLLGGDLGGAGEALGRVGGFALLSLGIACWPRRNAGGTAPALAAMLTYNLLATLYLGYLGVGGHWVGPLLWPAALLHGVVTALLVRAWLGRRSTAATGNG